MYQHKKRSPEEIEQAILDVCKAGPQNFTDITLHARLAYGTAQKFIDRLVEEGKLETYVSRAFKKRNMTVYRTPLAQPPPKP